MDPREWLFDKRVVRRNLEKGVLTWKTYNEYVNGTPDLEDTFEVINFESQEQGGDGSSGETAGDDAE